MGADFGPDTVTEQPATPNTRFAMAVHDSDDQNEAILSRVDAPKLDKLIDVEVSILWLLDVFWVKYRKWIPGGLGTALASAIGPWWKNRQPKAGTT